MERKFEQLPGAVKVVLANGQVPEDVVPVLLEAAELARARRKHLLVVSGLDDPATAETVSAAIQKMHALGTSPARIAFVAYALPQYSVYHFAMEYAERFGIAAKVLVALNDARDGLGSREKRESSLAAKAP